MEKILSSRSVIVACAAIIFVAFFASNARTAEDNITKTWAIAEFGEPLYKDGLDHWPYANPNAPKGGAVTIADFGTYDTFNPIILKGEFPSSIGHLYDSLMVGSSDELLSAYGLIAESVEYPEDKSWIIFNINPKARYSDGVPITAEDFKYAFEVRREHGRPFLKSFIEDIESAEVLSDHRIKFSMRTRDTMKPLIIAAGFSPMPRHFWGEHDVTKTSLAPPPASGAYEIIDFEPGRSITYGKVEDYWAEDLPVNKGLNNFDKIRYEYYRDETVQFEAFKAGEIDFRSENSAKRWNTGYEFDGVKKGQVILDSLPNESPRGISAFFFNLRQPQLQDIRVREAIGYLYDFEAIQRTLLFGEYQRVKSYFPNSDYGVSGLPTEEELAILEPFRDQLPPEVFTEAFEPPKTDGSGRNRANLRQALSLFNEAGWQLKNGKLVHHDSGEQLKFEILTASPESERLALPFIQNLKKAGVDASVRRVDVPQWRTRIENLDFDVYTARNNFFPPPGTELRSYFGSESAKTPGGGNRVGFISPVADALIDQIVAAKDLETLKATTRALDRVLLANHNVVPLYYPDETWIAYWNRFAHPERLPKYGHGFITTWWIDPELDAALPKGN
ncbi:MAG: extracellular solute-binding protein [Pseudomonadota bacterium]